MAERFRISHSQLATARACSRRYEFEYIRQRVPIRKSDALKIGTLWHQTLERWWTTGPERAVQWLVEHADQVSETDAAMLSAMLTHYRPPVRKYETLEVEGDHVLPVFNPATGRAMQLVDLVAKPDALVRDRATGELWLIEHKTSSEDITGFGPYWQRLAIDPQIAIYLLATGAVGVLYDVARKPRHRPSKEDDTKAAKLGMTQIQHYQQRVAEEIGANLDSYYQFREIRKTPDDLVEAQWDIYQQTLILREQRKNDWYPRNPNACRGMWGTCPYLDVCTGAAQLEDDTLFTDKGTRNAEETNR